MLWIVAAVAAFATVVIVRWLLARARSVICPRCGEPVGRDAHRWYVDDRIRLVCPPCHEELRRITHSDCHRGRAPKGLVVLLVALAAPSIALAHGGGLDSSGGHHNRKTGGYHCPREPCLSNSQPRPKPALKKPAPKKKPEAKDPCPCPCPEKSK